MLSILLSVPFTLPQQSLLPLPQREVRSLSLPMGRGTQGAAHLVPLLAGDGQVLLIHAISLIVQVPFRFILQTQASLERR